MALDIAVRVGRWTFAVRVERDSFPVRVLRVLSGERRALRGAFARALPAVAS